MRCLSDRCGRRYALLGGRQTSSGHGRCAGIRLRPGEPRADRGGSAAALAGGESWSARSTDPGAALPARVADDRRARGLIREALAGLPAIARFGFCQRPAFGARDFTSASVASASATSPGEALSSRTPSGRPPPSTSTIHFVPLPPWFFRLRSPFFGRGEAAVQERLLPSQQAFAVERTQQRSPRVQPHASSSHRFNRRQQVRRRILVGQKPPRAPVCSNHRMPSRQARLQAHGRPRLSLRRFGSGNSGATNSHCASLNNSNRFLLMQQENQTVRLTKVPSLKPNLFMKHARGTASEVRCRPEDGQVRACRPPNT